MFFIATARGLASASAYGTYCFAEEAVMIMHRRQSRHRAAARRTARFVLAIWCAVPVYAAGAADAGLVVAINGAPALVLGDQTRPLQRGESVAIGNHIRTDHDAKVKLLLSDDSVLAIGPDSEVVIDQLLLGSADRSARLRVLAGRFKLAVSAWLGGKSDYEVATPTAIAGVRGTVLWGDTGLDAICDLHGTVQVRTLRGGAATTLAAGHCVTGMGKGTTTPLTPSKEDLQRYLSLVTLD